MIVENPELPISYERVAESYREAADLFEEKIADYPSLEGLSEVEVQFLESCRQAIEPTRRCCEVFMRLAALGQQIIDEQEQEPSL